MKEKGIPQWFVLFTQSFLEDRTTTLALGKFQGPWQKISTGIPQGSPLAPILFLFFVASLLPLLQSHNTSAGGFVDDTNILAWSYTTEENCRILEEKHKACEAWAKRHGVRFAPEKYELIHFTRRRGRQHNLKAPITIQGHQTSPTSPVRILGFWIDSRLRWQPHIRKLEGKAIANIEAIQRLTASTWGATFHQSKLLYSAIVRPALTYGAQVWSQGQKVNTTTSLVLPLQKVQARCLRKITGAYKSTNVQVMEHETGIPPVDIYTKGVRLAYAESSATRPVQQVIQAAKERVLASTPLYSRQKTHLDWKSRDRHALAQHPSARVMVDRDWEARWTKASNKDQRTSWRPAAHPQQWTARPNQRQTPTPQSLYRGLTRAQASIATQLRTEHIGFRSYLFRRKVPGITDPSCPCGYHSQNVKHMLMTCPTWSAGRGLWLQRARVRTAQAVLNNREDLKRITQWIIQQGFLAQYKLVPAVEEEIQRRAPSLAEPG